jgi:hypothetical protein
MYREAPAPTDQGEEMPATEIGPASLWVENHPNTELD